MNGVATDIVLDSGAGMTVLDSALAKTLGLGVEGELEARGTGGNVGAGLVSGVTVKLAGMEIGPLSAAVIDLSGVGRRAGRPTPLILGKELFHALVVGLDTGQGAPSPSTATTPTNVAFSRAAPFPRGAPAASGEPRR